MRLIARLLRVFRRPASRPRCLTDEAIERGLIQRYAEGNTSLQLGEYITESDMDSLRKQVLAHDFKAVR